MNPTLRNVLAVIGAIVIGSIVNYGIVALGPNIIPAPDGVDPKDINSIKANAHLYSFKHFIVPLVAHALGTLAGAFAVSKLAVSRQKTLAFVIGIFFMLGGITVAILVPELLKYSIIDLIVAYIPMAWLGWSLAGKP